VDSVKLLAVGLAVLSIALLGLFAQEKYVVPAHEIADFTATQLELGFAGSHERLAYVAVNIQGISLRLMVDTGYFAPLSINSDVLDRLDVEFTGRKASRDMHGKIYLAREYVLPELSLGELTLSDVPGVENLTSPSGFDGTVGLELLRNFNLLLDYRGGRFTLLRKDRRPQELAEDGWFRYRGGISASFEVSLDGTNERYAIGLDSGCSYTTVDSDSPLGRALRATLGEDERYQAVTEAGETLFVYPDVHLLLDGRYDLGPSTCVVTDIHPPVGDGFLGYDLFWNSTVFVDHEAGEIWLRRAETDGPPNPEKSPPEE
jgi:hypothetical protein